MNIGILYYNEIKKGIPELPILDSIKINNFYAYSKNYNSVERLNDFDKLDKDIVWISNLINDECSSDQLIFSSWKKHYNLNVLTLDWLELKIETLANKISAKIPEELDLVFESILRLINVLEIESKEKISFSRSLANQIQIKFNNSKLKKDELDPQTKNFFYNREFNGVTLPVEFNSTYQYRKVDVNPGILIQRILSIKFPFDNQWARVSVKTVDLNKQNAMIMSLNSKSIRPLMDKNNFSLLKFIKEVFMSRIDHDGLIWVNNHELELIEKYFEFEIVCAYENSNLFNLKIPSINEDLDFISVTKNNYSYLFLQNLLNFQNDPICIWAKSILLKELFLKAIKIIEANIQLTFFNFQCFHFQCPKEELENCILISLENGLQPNVTFNK